MKDLSPRRRIRHRLLQHAPRPPLDFPGPRRRRRRRAVGPVVDLVRRDTLYKSANRRVKGFEVVDLCVNQSVSRVDGVEVTIEMRRDNLIYALSLTLPSF